MYQSLQNLLSHIDQLTRQPALPLSLLHDDTTVVTVNCFLLHMVALGKKVIIQRLVGTVKDVGCCTCASHCQGGGGPSSTQSATTLQLHLLLHHPLDFLQSLCDQLDELPAIRA